MIADTQGVELGVPDFTTRRPWFETEMTIGFRPRRGRNATLNLIFFFEKRVVRVIKINLFLFELGHPNMIKPHIAASRATTITSVTCPVSDSPQHDKTAHRGEPRDDDHFGHNLS